MNEPTPAGSATAREVIARWMGNLGLTHEEKLLAADKLMAFLAADGYRIAEAGAVTIPLKDAWAIKSRLWSLTDNEATRLYDVVTHAIAAASEPAE